MRFVVIREQGRGWDPSRAMRQQEHWPDHVTFVNGIVDQGSMLLGGPLSELDRSGEPVDPTDAVGPNRTYRALIVLEADTEEELGKLLDDSGTHNVQVRLGRPLRRPSKSPLHFT